MFSGCPSVPYMKKTRKKKQVCGAACFMAAEIKFSEDVRPSEAWNTLFRPIHGSVGPPDQPWLFYGMSVRPSVRPERFPGIYWRTHGGNDRKFHMLMYLDYLQNWLDYSHSLLIFLLLTPLNETGQIGVSVHFSDNTWREWPAMLHADVFWPPSELICSRPGSVDFSNFGTILTSWNGSNLGFPSISWRTHEGNSLKFCMLMYLDHLQNWLIYGHYLLSFLILALFWHCERGQIWHFRAFPGELTEGMAWNFACCCILTTFSTDYIMVTVFCFF